DVAMDDALAMRVRDGLGDGGEMRQQREPLVERLALVDLGGQRRAAEQRHREERLAGAEASGLVHADDRGMLEPRGQPRSALEPANERRARDIADAGRGLLDRDEPAEPAVERAKDPAHSAAPFGER